MILHFSLPHTVLHDWPYSHHHILTTLVPTKPILTMPFSSTTFSPPHSHYPGAHYLCSQQPYSHHLILTTLFSPPHSHYPGSPHSYCPYSQYLCCSGEYMVGENDGSEKEVVRIGLVRTKVVRTMVVRLRWWENGMVRLSLVGTRVGVNNLTHFTKFE